MTTFQLDTSGRVECPASFQPLGWAIWSDLTPFAQGYVEAMFDTPVGPAELWVGKAFSDLAPATLARIVEDCERVADHAEFFADDPGASFWLNRQSGWPAWCARRPDLPGRFPPLTVVLADDGRVYLREAG